VKRILEIATRFRASSRFEEKAETL